MDHTEFDRCCAALAKLPFFANLPAKAIGALAEASTLRSVAEGDILWRRGEPCPGFHLVLRGRVAVFRDAPNGRRYILNVFQAGEAVAMVPAVDGRPYPASGQVVEQGEVLTVPRGALQETLLLYPSATSELACAVACQARDLLADAGKFGLTSVPGRLAGYILECAAQAGEPAPDPAPDLAGLQVDLGLTREDLAARLGTVREVVSRTLSEWAERGIIQVRGRKVRIVDAEGLRRLAEG